MRYSIFFFSILLFAACASNSTFVTIPANQSVEVATNNYQRVAIKNKSLRQIDVKVLDKQSQEFISGFGLGTKGKANVPIASNGQLVLTNNSNKPSKARVFFKEVKAVQENTSASSNTKTKSDTTAKKYVSFTLANKTAKSIPLIIPSVMNPNLSPFSRSGVDLKIGQKILFKAKGKKYVLLTVDNTIKDGDVLNVGSLLKQKQKELGL